MNIKRGITRTVWLVGPFAIKFPSLRYCGTFFFSGCLANLSEAFYWNDLKDRQRWMAPVYWCAWFGLFLVMKRAQPLQKFNNVGYPHLHGSMDCKPDNLGVINGEVVWVDYA